MATRRRFIGGALAAMAATTVSPTTHTPAGADCTVRPPLPDPHDPLPSRTPWVDRNGRSIHLVPIAATFGLQHATVAVWRSARAEARRRGMPIGDAIEQATRYAVTATARTMLAEHGQAALRPEHGPPDQHRVACRRVAAVLFPELAP